MVFSSISFLYVFLPAVLLIYSVVPRKWKNLVLLLFSLIFYYIGEQMLVLLMIFSAVTDFLCSLGIEHNRGKKGLCRAFLCLSLLVNLSLLGYFKYADFFIRTVNAVTGAGFSLLHVALPIGISFYTFQTMSYTIDVYRGKIKATHNFIDFAAFVTLFPQLVAGPIVRYETVSEELNARTVTPQDFSEGVRRFLTGLGKKVLLANQLASLISVCDTVKSRTVILAWAAALAFPLQIYFDFSGYSDMAIGLGRMFGFHFPENFDYPFMSRSAGEFWRRWHKTLGTWFRDYLYIPLGGNRVNTGRCIINLMIVWFATGLWHGASYNYVLWGLYYGILLVCERYLYGKWLDKHKIVARLYFAVITIFGFVIFRTEDAALILPRVKELFGCGTASFVDTQSWFYLSGYWIVLLSALFFATPLWKKATDYLETTKIAVPVLIIRYILLLGILVLSTAYLVDGSYNPFLYFRF